MLMAIPFLFYRPEFAYPDAGLAPGTKFGMNPCRLLLLPGNGITWTGLQAQSTHLTFIRIHLETN